MRSRFNLGLFLSSTGEKRQAANLYPLGGGDCAPPDHCHLFGAGAVNPMLVGKFDRHDLVCSRPVLFNRRAGWRETKPAAALIRFSAEKAPGNLAIISDAIRFTHVCFGLLIWKVGVEIIGGVVVRLILAPKGSHGSRALKMGDCDHWRQLESEEGERHQRHRLEHDTHFLSWNLQTAGW